MTLERPWAKVTANFGATLSTEKQDVGNNTVKNNFVRCSFMTLWLANTEYKILIRICENEVIDTNTDATYFEQLTNLTTVPTYRRNAHS